MKNEYAIELIEIDKRFGAARALAGATLRVRRGSVHALIGGNGAGKSTLLKILDGVYPAGTYEGTIKIDGTTVTIRSPRDARRHGIGYVPQELSVVEPLTVAENVFLGNVGKRRSPFVSPRDLFRRARDLLAELAIDLDPKSPAAILSGSERQLLMIARALALNPAVLVLDEATARLTEPEAENLARSIRFWRDRGLACVFVTHRLREVESLADRVSILRDGAIVAEFERGSFSYDSISKAMIGDGRRSNRPVDPPQTLGAESIRVERLTIPHPRRSRRTIVENIDFHAREGEILGVAGLVGAGRSALLSAIFGRLPYRGRITIRGRIAPIRSPRAARSSRIGYLTEDRGSFGLLFNLDIRANVTLASLARVSRFGLVDRIQETKIAESFRQALSIRTPSTAESIDSLSGGGRQKVLLARELAADPDILLLDEPFQGVDVASKFDIGEIIRQTARRGKTVVVVCSETSDLLDIADRIVVLARGRIIDHMNKNDFDEARILRAAVDEPHGNRS